MGLERKESQQRMLLNYKVSSAALDKFLVAVTASLSLLVVTSLTLTPITTNDFWLNLKIGGMILENKGIPTTALFEFTEARDFPFVAYEWLSSLFLYLIHKVGGYEGAIVVKALFGYILFGLTVLLAYQISRHAILSIFIGVVTMMATNFRHFLRPEIFAYTLLLIHLNCIVRYTTTKNTKWLIALIPLQVVWVNSHGSYLVGFVFLPTFALGYIIDAFVSSKLSGTPFDFKDQLRMSMPYFVAFLAILGCTLVNPYGPRLIEHSWELSSSTYIKKAIYEWAPTISKRFAGSIAFKVYLAYLAIYAACLVIGFRYLRTTPIILAVLFLYLSLDAQRHIAVFAFVNSLVLAHLVKERLQDVNGKAIFVAIFAVALLSVTGFVYYKGNFVRTRPGLTFSTRFSKEAIEFMRERDLKGNVLNSYALASQLIYHFYPDIKVTIDSRIDIFGERYWKDYNRLFRDLPYLVRFLRKYNVRYIILTPRDLRRNSATIRHLQRFGWYLMYQDPKIFIMSH